MKMKQLLFTIVAMMLWGLTAGAAIRKVADFREGGIWYSVNNDGETVSVDWDGQLQYVGIGHGCYTGNVVVPQTVTHNGTTYTVTRIADYAFYFCIVSSVTLPSTIESIGQEAFRGTWNTELVLPSSLRRIAHAAFAESQILEIVIPSGVEELPNFAFRGAQLSKITLPSTVKRIGKECFFQSHLTKCTIPDGVERIEDGTFGESPLEEVFLPTTLKYIGNYAFKKTKISNVMLHEGIDSIGTEAFRESPIEQITLPTTVTYLGENAFRECANLSYVSMNCPGLKEIGQYTFYNCAALNQISALPDAVKSIGNYAFNGCAALENFEISPSSQLTSIGQNAFQNSGLYAIVLPNGVSKMGKSAFAECTSLQSVNIPENLVVLEESTFSGCTSLKTVTFSTEGQLKKIESKAFYNCIPLESLTLPEGLEDIGEYMYDIKYPNVGQLNYVYIPSTVKSIGAYALNKYANSTHEIAAQYREMVFDFATPIDSVGSDVFAYAERINISNGDGWIRLVSKCTNVFGYYHNYPHVYLNGNLLTEYVIPDDITTIKHEAFKNNKDIVSVVFPNGLHTIEWSAFLGCSSLQTVTFGDSIKNIGGSCFNNCNIQRVNIASVESWSRLVVECGYQQASSWWTWFPAIYLNDEPMVDYVIPEGVTAVRSSTFKNNTAIRSITFPNSMTSIGEKAFQGCTNLETVVCSDALKTIGNGAFSGCSSLKEVTFGSGIENIDWAFNSCVVQKLNITNYEGWIDIILNANTNKFKWSSFPSVYYNGQPLTEYAIPEGITTIREGAFQGNTHIQSLVLPNSIQSIGKNSFYDCRALADITFGDSPEAVIGYRAFFYCPIERANITVPASFVRMVLNSPELEWSWLYNVYYNGVPYTDYVIPEGITSIREKAFYQNNEITSVVFPNTLIEIGYRAFYNCKGMKEVYIGNSLKTIRAEAFYGCWFDKVDIGDIANWCGVTFEGNVVYADRDDVYMNSHPLTKKPSTVPVYAGGNEITQLRIPTSVKKVGRFAFFGASQLESVTIPNSVESIDDYAFMNCADLTTLKYGKTPQLDSIGYKAFANTPLFNLELPASLTTMGDAVFSGCKSLQSITIPGNVSIIPTEAFANCTGLNQVHFSEGLTSIKSRAFRKCPFASLGMPTTLKSIADGAFAECLNIENIYIKDLAAWCEVKTEGRIYEQYNDTKDKHYYLNGELIEGDVVIPEGVTSIGGSAFYDHCDFTSITIPEGVKSIGSWAFNGTSLIRSISLPSSIEYMGNFAFGYQYGTVGTDRYEYYSPDHHGMVYRNLYDGQRVSVYVKDLSSFINANRNDGLNFYNGVDGTHYSAELYVDGQLITDLVVPEGVTSISNKTFVRFDFKSITLPSTLEYIEDYAFFICESLKYIYCRPRNAASGTAGLNAASPVFVSFYVPQGRIDHYKAKWPNVASWLAEAPETYTPSGTITLNSLTTELTAHTFVYDDQIPCLDLSDALIDEDVTAEVLQDIADRGTIIFLPESMTGITGTNIVCEGTTPRLVLRDSTDFAAPYDFTAQQLVHQRRFAPIGNGATSMCLPYNLDALPQGMKAFALTEQMSADLVRFTEVGSTEANMPYMVTTTIPVDSICVTNAAFKSTPTVMPDGGVENLVFRGTFNTISNDEAADMEAYILDDATRTWLSAYDNMGLNVVPGRAYLLPADGIDTPPLTCYLKEITPGVYLTGDVNGDGDVDIADAVCIVNHVVGKPNVVFNATAADANGDGDVDIADAVHIVNFVVGKISALARRFDHSLPEPQ